VTLANFEVFYLLDAGFAMQEQSKTID